MNYFIRQTTIKIPKDKLYCIRNRQGEYYRGAKLWPWTRYPNLFGIAKISKSHLEDIVLDNDKDGEWYIEKF
jgi:hypothetical protein